MANEAPVFTLYSDGKKLVVANIQLGGAYSLLFPYLTRIDSAIIQDQNTSGVLVLPISGGKGCSGETAIGIKYLDTSSGNITSGKDVSGRYVTVWAVGN